MSRLFRNDCSRWNSSFLVSGGFRLWLVTGHSFQTETSASLAKLQAEKAAFDKVLQDITSVQSSQDVDGLRDYLQNTQLKVEVRKRAPF